MAAAIERMATMGNKPPKSKERGQKQKNTAGAADAAAARTKQTNQSYAQPPAKGGK